MTFLIVLGWCLIGYLITITWSRSIMLRLVDPYDLPTVAIGIVMGPVAIPMNAVFEVILWRDNHPSKRRSKIVNTIFRLDR